MSGFGENLGELAGQDIILWREAGLDPRSDRRARDGVHLERLMQRVASWTGQMCRQFGKTLGGNVHRTQSSLAFARVLHVRRSPNSESH